MTKEEYRLAMGDVIYLSSCAVNGTAPDKERVARMNLGQLYEAARRHMLCGITASALESAKVHDEAFAAARGKAIRKVLIMEREKTALFEELERAGIWYMPLKGCVLKDMYPQLGMREMADYDILFDEGRAEDVRRIMERLGFTTEYYERGNHDVYYKRPLCNFEMHRSLFGRSHERRIYEYYSNVKPRLIKDEGSEYGYSFGGEDFYIYITAHEYKHYSGGGTGLRSLLDIYVCLKRQGKKLDWKYIHAELEKLGIAEFEDKNRNLAMRLFEGAELSAADSEMLNYILFSGTYGNAENRIQNQLKSKGSMGFLFSRAFPTYEMMRRGYPVLNKIPILLPVCWIIRLVKALIFKRGKLKRELGAAFKH